MPATFTYTPTALRTATVDGLPDCIVQVDFDVIGTQDGQTFGLPATTDLHAPDAGNFKQLADVTEADVVGWIEGAFGSLDGVKGHVQMVLDQVCARAVLTDRPLPWVSA